MESYYGRWYEKVFVADWPWKVWLEGFVKLFSTITSRQAFESATTNINPKRFNSMEGRFLGTVLLYFSVLLHGVSLQETTTVENASLSKLTWHDRRPSAKTNLQVICVLDRIAFLVYFTCFCDDWQFRIVRCMASYAHYNVRVWVIDIVKLNRNCLSHIFSVLIPGYCVH